tara:strand:- start:191 stop:391 length:201 start_codon:yes stop_codon:yes gene_type:complete
MNRSKQLKMIENYIKKHGVTRCRADTRGKDSVQLEYDLIRKKLRAELILKKKARNRRFKLFSKGDS